MENNIIVATKTHIYVKTPSMYTEIKKLFEVNGINIKPSIGKLSNGFAELLLLPKEMDLVKEYASKNNCKVIIEVKKPINNTRYIKNLTKYFE